MVNQIWHQNSPGIAGGAETSDNFGNSLISGDFNNDGHDDLAIGVSGEDIGTINSAGATNVLLGSNGGLTATGDQIWHQDSSGVEGVAETFDLFSSSLASGDFNNDGYDDLAIGVIREDVDFITDAGAVNVLFGSNTGLTAAGDQIWHQDSPGVAGGAEDFDNFGRSLTSGDFDNDGYDDLAIGVSGEDIGAINAAGAVNVLFGSNTGLTATGNQIWHQDSPGIAGGAEAGDNFGNSLASGDFDNDGYDDLAIGVSGEDVNSIVNAGTVNVLFGSNTGLTAVDDQIWHQNSSGVEGVAETSDNFGNSLASGDFDNDGYDDLAIGVSGEDIGAINAAGAVNVLYGSNTGLTATGDQIWHQNTPGVAGGAEADDNFGNSLASGDFNNDGYDDLAIGVSGEDVGSLDGAGSVNILYGSNVGLTTTGNQIWHQDSPGVAGGAEAFDHFGSSLGVGDFNDDGYDDLAIGVSGEDVGSIINAGATNILYGSATGLIA